MENRHKNTLIAHPSCLVFRPLATLTDLKILLCAAGSSSLFWEGTTLPLVDGDAVLTNTYGIITELNCEVINMSGWLLSLVSDSVACVKGLFPRLLLWGDSALNLLLKVLHLKWEDRCLFCVLVFFGFISSTMIAISYCHLTA